MKTASRGVLRIFGTMTLLFGPFFSRILHDRRSIIVYTEYKPSLNIHIYCNTGQKTVQWKNWESKTILSNSGLQRGIQEASEAGEDMFGSTQKHVT
jgi:hypothetical protein